MILSVVRREARGGGGEERGGEGEESAGPHDDRVVSDTFLRRLVSSAGPA